eukprot:7123840-Pyramimonas_sp.AAC.1
MSSTPAGGNESILCSHASTAETGGGPEMKPGRRFSCASWGTTLSGTVCVGGAGSGLSSSSPCGKEASPSSLAARAQ